MRRSANSSHHAHRAIGPPRDHVVERAQKRQPHARAIAGHARGAVLERGEVRVHAARDAPAEVRERQEQDERDRRRLLPHLGRRRARAEQAIAQRELELLQVARGELVVRDRHRVGEEAHRGLGIVDGARRPLEPAADDDAHQQPQDRQRAQQARARRRVAELGQPLRAQRARGLEVAVVHEAVGEVHLLPQPIERGQHRRRAGLRDSARWRRGSGRCPRARAPGAGAGRPPSPGLPQWRSAS